MVNRNKRLGNKHPKTGVDTALQRKAERLVGKTGPSAEELALLSPQAIQDMLHDLRVHQIELEMQNEELRSTQIELASERARYFDLYDLAPVGYCTISEQGVIQQANLTAANMVGMSRRALVAQPISRFICNADQDIYYLCRKQLIETGKPQACELQMLKKDGTQFWVNLASTYTLDSRGMAALRIALTDITESKTMAGVLQESELRYHAMSDVLHDKNVELERTKSVAEKANLAKSDFLSSMSHELRTPLSAILGFAQLIDVGPQAPTPSQKQSLDQIISAGWYLLDLINEILDLAQIDSGKLALTLEPVALTTLVQECMAMIEPQAQRYGVSVTSPQDKGSYFVYADRTRMKQVLINLLSNAIKYNKRGGTVVVNYQMRSPGRIRIVVQDTGKGLTPEKLEQLFQPFNRLGQESNTVKGTGIGLVVCKRLVELMGGAIGVESIVDEGSEFWIELLWDAVPQFAEEKAARRTLLYVEDNPANLMLVEQIIEGHPHLRMLSARDGNLGVALARTHLPDVILMDINLPGISGIDALKILRNDPTTAHIPVLAISANAMPGDIEQGLAAGFCRYLTKPIKVNEFMAVLNTVLKLAETTSARTNEEEKV